MGRPFDDELGRLAASYLYACSADVSQIAREACSSLEGPLIAAGSGGSYTSAAFLRRLHSTATGRPSASMTPVELEAVEWVLPDTSIWIHSAGGKNNDILTATEAAIVLEPASISSLTTTSATPLEQRVSSVHMGHAFAFPSPAGRDGYLATNSLLISVLVLHRAFAAAMGTAETLPAFSELIDAAEVVDAVVDIDHRLTDLWEKEQLLLIHDATGAVGAVDLESKITEAAMSVISASDIRNFAHGRHHWLTRYGGQTAVLALVGRDTTRLAQRTLRLFPENVPRHIIELHHAGQLGDIEAILKAFLITASLGHSRNIDPGRPGVAAFGSRIYQLSRPRSARAVPIPKAAALRKKSAGAVESVALIENAAKDAMQALTSTNIGAVVFDLDGTLVSQADRWALEARSELKSAISNVMANGLAIGVATGRAATEKTKTLIRSFFPEKSWPSIVVGYHNGGFVTDLADDEIESNLNSESDDHLVVAKLQQELEARLSEYGSAITLEISHGQLTVRPAMPNSLVRPSRLSRIAHEAIALLSVPLKVICSTHSIDIVSTKTSKRNVVDRIGPMTSGEVLRIGDMGHWPGNDFELLASPFGLSVDRISADLYSCWNFLPRGIRSTEGLIYYLRLLQPVGKAHVRFDGLKNEE